MAKKAVKKAEPKAPEMTMKMLRETRRQPLLKVAKKMGFKVKPEPTHDELVSMIADKKGIVE